MPCSYSPWPKVMGQVFSKETGYSPYAWIGVGQHEQSGEDAGSEKSTAGLGTLKSYKAKST